jgi:hypothetical protein
MPVLVNFVVFLSYQTALVIMLAIFLIIFDILAYDIIEIKKYMKLKYLTIYSNQKEANNDLHPYLKNKRKINKVYMIEFSSSIVTSLLREIVEKNKDAMIRLLLKHPDGETEADKRRIMCMVESVFLSDREYFTTFTDFRIKFYKENTSFRGRKFDDDLINIGWCPYVQTVCKVGSAHGDKQPTMSITKKHDDFGKIDDMFTEVFDNLWKNGSNLQDVLDTYKIAYNKELVQKFT